MSIATRSRNRAGFTLTEVMITTALIGVMAALAIPNFLSYQARSRRSEAYANLAGVATAYKAYHAETGVYPDMFTTTSEASLPDPTAAGQPGTIGTKKLTWDGPTKNFFDIVGWEVEGSVFYTYDINSSTANGCTCTQCFTATAHGDVDGDGAWSAVMLVHPERDQAGNVTGECTSTFGPPPSGTGLPAPVDKNGDSLYDAAAVYTVLDDY